MTKAIVNFIRIIPISVCLLIVGCHDNDDEVKDLVPAGSVNDRPELFDVSVLGVTSSTATIEWKGVHDADNDKLYQQIELEGANIADNLLTDGIYKFNGLKPLTNYSGRVVVSDMVNEPVAVPFTFTTKQYVLTFDRLFDGYSGRIPMGTSIAPTSDGGYVIGGIISFFQTGYGLYVLKTDSLGFEQWHTAIDGTAVTSIGVIRETSDRGFITVNGNNLYKLDRNGNLSWQVNGLPFTSVIETDDHEYIALLGGGMVSRYSNGGLLLWSKYYDKNDFTQGTYITSVADGNFVLLGTAGSSVKNDINVTMISSDGIVLWNKFYENTKYDFAKKSNAIT